MQGGLVWKRGRVRAAALAIMAVVALVCASSAQAASRVGGVVKGFAILSGIKAAAKPLNDFINTITLQRGVATREATRVVPILSVGVKTYVGAAQVTGPAWRVNQVKAVLELTGELSGGKHRVAIYIPSSSDNPLKIGRVSDVGVSALIEGTLWGKKLDPVGGKTHSDLIRAALITWVVKEAGPPIDKGIRALTRIDFPTKVVPHLSVGSKGYIGLAQVVGQNAELAKVDAVATYEETFRDRYRIRIAIPVATRDLIKLSRIHGVGVNAFVLTTIHKDAAKPQPRVVAAPVPAPVPAPAPPPPAGGYYPPPPPPPTGEYYPPPPPPAGGAYEPPPPPPPPLPPGQAKKGRVPPGWSKKGYGTPAAEGDALQRLWNTYFYDAGGVARCRAHRLARCGACVAAYEKDQRQLLKHKKKYEKKKGKKSKGRGRWGDEDDDDDGYGHGRGRGKKW